MNYRILSDADLVDFAKNVGKNLLDHKITCLDNAVADDLAATLNPLNATFETKIEESAVSEAATKAVNAEKRDQRSLVEEKLGPSRLFSLPTKVPKQIMIAAVLIIPKRVRPSSQTTRPN